MILLIGIILFWPLLFEIIRFWLNYTSALKANELNSRQCFAFVILIQKIFHGFLQLVRSNLGQFFSFESSFENHTKYFELRPQPFKRTTIISQLHSIFLFFLHFQSIIIAMESLKRQNEELRKVIESIIQEIQHQKQLNSQHETQIQTLLKFNERLLNIIENELNNKKDARSLQPISEKSQRESDLIGPTLNSLIKSRKLVAKSQIGFNGHNSLVEKVKTTNYRLIDIFREKEALKSEDDKSYDFEEFSDHKLEFKTTSGGPPTKDITPVLTYAKAEGMSKTLQQSKLVQEEMSQGIAELKKFRNKGGQFYENKIKEIKGLSSKLSSYRPSEQLKAIAEKLTLSQSTSQLLKKTMQRRETKQ